VNAVEIVGTAEPARQIIDAAGLGEGQGERPRQEVITPVEITLVAVGHGAPQGADEGVYDRVEVAGHHEPAEFLGVVHLRNQREIGFPAGIATLRAIEQRMRESIDDVLDRRRCRASSRHDRLQTTQPLGVQQLRAAHEHGLEQQLLTAEVVVDQRHINPGGGRDVAHRNRMKATLGEQQLGRIEDAASGVGGTSQSGAASAAGRRDRFRRLHYG